MKAIVKNILAVGIAVGILSVGTDSMADKISPQLRVKMLETRRELTHHAPSAAAEWPQSQAQSVMVTVTSSFDERVLEDHGMDVDRRCGNVVFGSVNTDNIDVISHLEGVKKIDMPRLERVSTNMVRQATGVDRLHDGIKIPTTPNDVIPFTGKGVVIGIVDGGINPHHIAFQDREDGTRKVMRYQLTYGAPESGNQKLRVDAYDTPEEIADAPVDMGAGGHGTHTSGIAAGWYMGNPYYGIAPDAEMVMTSMGNRMYSDEISYGIIDALDYAASQKKPVVVSLSLGTPLGNHKGENYVTSLLEDALNPGEIVCYAAGNDGAGNVSLRRNFSQSPRPLYTALAKMYYGTPAESINVDISSKDEREFDLQLTLIDMSTRKETWRSPALSTMIEDDDDTEPLITLLNTHDGVSPWPEIMYNFNGSFYFAADRKANSKGFTEVQLVADFTAVKGYAIGLALTSADGADVLMTCDGVNCYFSSLQAPGYTYGNGNNSLSENCFSPYVVSVGSWNARKEWTDTEGEIHQLNASYFGPYGEVAYYSSHGVTRDEAEEVLPHVLAPGTSVLAPVAAPRETLRYSAAYATDADGNEYCWGENSGTSMATPAAAGIIALWLQADPTLTRDDIIDVLAQTSNRDEAVERSPEQVRYGKIDAYEGLKYILDHKSSVGSMESDYLSGLMLRYHSHTDIEVTVPFACTAGTATLLSAAGASVMNREVASGTFRVDTEHLAPGMYILIVNTPQGVASAKIIR